MYSCRCFGRRGDHVLVMTQDQIVQVLTQCLQAYSHHEWSRAFRNNLPTSTPTNITKDDSCKIAPLSYLLSRRVYPYLTRPYISPTYILSVRSLLIILPWYCVTLKIGIEIALDCDFFLGISWNRYQDSEISIAAGTVVDLQFCFWKAFRILFPLIRLV